MTINIYQIDAFTDQLFHGNPAAVCPLEDKWLPREILQKITTENNLAETAFYLKKNGEFYIRWFTPKSEVDLCGHATLATAFVLFEFENYTNSSIVFNSNSGKLFVTKNNGIITLNFPTDKIINIQKNDELLLCFDIEPIEIYKGNTDYMYIFENENQIVNINVDLFAISKIDARGIIITAKGDSVDFVSRFFAPKVGIPEDPVTGSAHTTLIPYWYKSLNKTRLIAVQLSERRGFLRCEYLNDRVEISGNAVCYMKGIINI